MNSQINIWRTLLLTSIAIFVFSSHISAQNRKSVSAAEVTGTFKISGEDGSEQEFRVLALGKNQLRVRFAGYNAGAGNSDEARGTATIIGDAAIFTPQNINTGCEIVLKFVRRGVLRVTHNSSEAECGLAPGVTAAGTYRKTSSSKPKFN